jgi:hypothetical protein
MRKFVFAFVAGIALSGPAMAQDAYHIRIGDQIYDIRTGSSDGGVVLSTRPAAGWRKFGKRW